MATQTKTRRRARAIAVGGAALTFAFFLAACNSSDSSDGASAEPAGGPASGTEAKAEPTGSAPYEVRTTTETLVDASRPTAEGRATPALSDRTLETTIAYPDDPGPFPLVVLSHGSTGRPERLTELAATWARAGYVVAAPAFPLTNADVPEARFNVGDVSNQPGDVSFVIDAITAANDDKDSPLFERVRTGRIGVAGHSLGGATTYGVTFAPCCVDERVDATVILSGVRLVEAGDELFDRATPILVFHGESDTALPFPIGVDAYAELQSPKWFVTLIGADHSTPYENPQSAWDNVVETTTTDFWDATIGADSDKASESAYERLLSDASVTGVATVETDRG
ncbi:MAG TPA: dienelactone hydrolase family protein [Acidimicrobiia bacterium]|nr:dienelactone hydrolase family protein [Acidimicrobiia bacterium]